MGCWPGDCSIPRSRSLWDSLALTGHNFPIIFETCIFPNICMVVKRFLTQHIYMNMASLTFLVPTKFLFCHRTGNIVWSFSLLASLLQKPVQMIMWEHTNPPARWQPDYRVTLLSHACWYDPMILKLLCNWWGWQANSICLGKNDTSMHNHMASWVLWVCPSTACSLSWVEIYKDFQMLPFHPEKADRIPCPCPCHLM